MVPGTKHVGLVEAWRDGQMICIDGAPPKALARLRTARVVAAPDARYGCSIRLQHEPLTDRWDGTSPGLPMVKFWAGLELPARTLLDRAGYQVAAIKPCQEDAPIALPEPDSDTLKDIGADRPFLDFMRNEERGLVLTNRDIVSPAWLVAQAALAYAEAKITVAVSNQDDGFSVLEGLRKHIPDALFFHNRHKPHQQARVAIATWRYLHHSPNDLFQRDIVFALHAREAVRGEGLEQLEKAHRARLFGLVGLTERFSPHESDLVRTVFGFEELVLPRPGHRERQVLVQRVQAPACPGLPEDADDYIVQRDAVWNNAPRNKLIAALASRAMEKTKGRVIVLVGLLQHALALAELLSGWAVIRDGSGVNTRGLTEAQLKLLHASDAGWDSECPYCIATSEGMKAINLKDVGAIVRADAGAALPPIPYEKLVEPNDGPRRPLLLIDMDDRHPLLRKPSQRRRQAYDERGWFAPGVCPAQRRAEMFLASRGK
jgi:hypothetical protein